MDSFDLCRFIEHLSIPLRILGEAETRRVGIKVLPDRSSDKSRPRGQIPIHRDYRAELEQLGNVPIKLGQTQLEAAIRIIIV